MFLRIRARLTRGAQGDHGFSTVEAVASAVLIGVIAASVSIAMSIAMRTSIVANDRAVKQITATRMLDGIATNISLADPLTSIGREKLTLLVTTSDTCERHTYLVGRNQFNTPRLIRHRVQVMPITSYGRCSDISPRVWNTTPYAVDREEIVNLADPPMKSDGSGLIDAPVFTYYAPGNSMLYTKNDPNFNANPSARKTFALPCKVAQVVVTLYVRENDDVRVYKTQAAPLGAILGQSTC